MQQETEVMFGNIDKEEMRKKLTAVGATCIRTEYDQRRVVFDLPTPDPNKWMRVRDEGDRITLSYKEAGTTLAEQQEAEIVVSDFATAIDILERIGCTLRTVQETKREQWKLDGVEITIDTWPHLEPLVEIEGTTEEDIRRVSDLLSLEYDQGIFGTVNHLYRAKYGKYIEELAEKRLEFSGENPFLKG